MAENVDCVVCKTSMNRPMSFNTIQGRGNTSISSVDCPRCGKFWVIFEETSLITKLTLTDEERGYVSGWIRENQGEEITADYCENLGKRPKLSPRQKSIRFLKNLARENPAVDMEWGRSWTAEENCFVAYAWAKDKGEMHYLLKHYLVEHEKWLYAQENGIYQITPKGWEFLGEPEQEGSSQGFIAMSFDDSLNAVGEVLEKGIQGAGYEALILKRHEHVNRIDDEIFAQIRKSKFVVVDLTLQNQGAYLEAGFALGLDKEVVWTCKKGEKVHFDARQFNTIFWEEDKLDVLEKALKNRIERIFGMGPINP